MIDYTHTHTYKLLFLTFMNNRNDKLTFLKTQFSVCILKRISLLMFPPNIYVFNNYINYKRLVLFMI